MEFKREERFEILKVEMGLIQSTLDKYDDLIFRNRNWFITIWTGAIGLGFTIRSDWLLLLAIVVSILYWFIEGMMRHQYWYKYVLRYRTLRNQINSESGTLDDLYLYDLTNHYMSSERDACERLKKSFFKLEPTVVYGGMSLSALLIWYLVDVGIIDFISSNCT